MHSTAGLNDVAAMLAAKYKYIAIGTDGSDESPDHTALLAEVGTRIEVTDPSFPDTGEFDLVGTFAPGNGTGVIREMGIFSAAVGGTMLTRKVISPERNKTASKSLKVSYLEGIAELVP